MWNLPRHVILTAGSGTGSTRLTAFDAALLDAGMGDLNLVQVSSIVPAGAEVTIIPRARKDVPGLDKGTIVPVVYSVITSDKPGQMIASALAVGIPDEGHRSGVIFEVARIGDRTGAEAAARDMVAEALAARAVDSYEILIVSAELMISDKYGCVLSAALLLP